jgi:hypothetical protein
MQLVLFRCERRLLQPKLRSEDVRTPTQARQRASESVRDDPVCGRLERWRSRRPLVQGPCARGEHSSWTCRYTPMFDLESDRTISTLNMIVRTMWTRTSTSGVQTSHQVQILHPPRTRLHRPPRPNPPKLGRNIPQTSSISTRRSVRPPTPSGPRRKVRPVR